MEGYCQQTCQGRRIPLQIYVYKKLSSLGELNHE